MTHITLDGREVTTRELNEAGRYDLENEIEIMIDELFEDYSPAEKKKGITRMVGGQILHVWDDGLEGEE